MVHHVTVIAGDGIGPEVVAAARRVVDATGACIAWDEQPLGMRAVEEHGSPLPEQTSRSLRRTRVGLKGPTTTASTPGTRSANVLLREQFELFACIRPARALKGVRVPFPTTDLVIVRENLEDTYGGIEFGRDEDEAAELRDWLRTRGASVPDDAGLTLKTMSVAGAERIVGAAFDYARDHGRARVTAVHKANIMRATDGLFLEVAREVAARHRDIEFDDRVVDAVCAQLVANPNQVDVIVAPNFIGDFLSDLAAGLVGGLGVAPGMNLGADIAVFEASHGSAPTRAGTDTTNPTALILSAALMLRHLGEDTAASRVEAAVSAVIAAGRSLTADLVVTGESAPVGTVAFTDEVIGALEGSAPG